MRWLLRYAVFKKVPLHSHPAAEQALRSQFSRAAWRLLCRSTRSDFLPLLRHRGLPFGALQRYVERLAQRGWQVAPPGWMLAYLIDQAYTYLDSPPEVPLWESAFNLMRVTTRQPGCTRRQFALVNDWRDQSRGTISARMQWPALLRRARQWRDNESVAARDAARAPWPFHCGEVQWLGWTLVPLRTPLDLWQEGEAMGSCLYKLRRLCEEPMPHRYFSVRRNGRRQFTLELVRCKGARNDTWRLLDCRRSYNRLPDPAAVVALRAFARRYASWERDGTGTGAAGVPTSAASAPARPRAHASVSLV